MILSDSSWRYINLALYPRLAADTVVDIKTEHSKIAYLCNKWLRRRHAIRDPFSAFRIYDIQYASAILQMIREQSNFYAVVQGTTDKFARRHSLPK